jgi:hypothetical protein
MEGPVLEIKNNNKSEYYTETFVSQSKNSGGGCLVTNNYENRLYKY